MNVKLKVLTAGVLFFTGQALVAQEAKKDSASIKEIDAVVILGYGKTSSKNKSTAASTTINASSLENRPTTSFLNSVQGAAPGISINSQSGSPGSGKINVRVRGISSLSASTDPLYVIDGIISTGTEYRNLNQNDIQTISVLKDAQATAIYGNYGASGVILITTKSGKFNSGLRVSYDVITSISTLPKHKYNLMSSKELLLVQNRLKKGLGSTMSVNDINNYDIETYWEDVFFRKSFTQNHNLGLRYGGENISGYTSLSYLDNQGIIKNTDFKRFTFRTNINGKTSNKRLTYSTQIALGYSKRHQLDIETNSSISNNFVQNPLLGTLMGAPYVAPYEGNGRQLFNQYKTSILGDARSIWILQDIINGGVQKQYSQTSISVNTSATYKILNNLNITNKTGINYKNNAFDAARTPNGFLSVAVAAGARTEFGGWEVFDNTNTALINSVTSLNYDKKFGKHNISLGAYIDYIKGFYYTTQQTQNGLDPLNWVLGAGTGYIPFNSSEPSKYLPSISAEKVKAGTLAYIGTFDYDYSSKYGISATIRRDGSYRFSDSNKWETFWSISGRWNIDQENFMEGSIFNTLKLRASYGTNGNQNLAQSTINTDPLFLASNLVRDIYTSSRGYQGLPGYITTLKNSNARWEKVSQANIGVDFALFSRKLEGSVDIYNKKTSDMYLYTPISAANGQYTINGNAGAMQNKGLEVSLKYTPFKKEEFNLSIFANLGYNKNKIISLFNEDLSSTIVNAVGGPAYQWQLYRYVGINPNNGEYQFLDKNGNITAAPTNNDRILTGKSAYAPYSGGFGLDIDYNGFYLTTLFSFQAGGWGLDTMDFWLHRPDFITSSNGSKDLLNAWTPTNKNTDMGALTANNTDLLSSSDKFLRKTDYIRLKNISLGYNINKDFLRNLPIKSLKVYLMAENLITLTGWKGFDPEVVLGSSLGVYPNAKVYSVGLTVDF